MLHFPWGRRQELKIWSKFLIHLDSFRLCAARLIVLIEFKRSVVYVTVWLTVNGLLLFRGRLFKLALIFHFGKYAGLNKSPFQISSTELTQ